MYMLMHNVHYIEQLRLCTPEIAYYAFCLSSGHYERILGWIISIHKGHSLSHSFIDIVIYNVVYSWASSTSTGHIACSFHCFISVNINIYEYMHTQHIYSYNITCLSGCINACIFLGQDKRSHTYKHRIYRPNAGILTLSEWVYLIRWMFDTHANIFIQNWGHVPAQLIYHAFNL